VDNLKNGKIFLGKNSNTSLNAEKQNIKRKTKTKMIKF